MGLFDKGYALIVGIANYTYVRRLSSTVLKDAGDISSLLKDPKYCGYSESHVTYLADDQATVGRVRNGMHWLIEQTNENDTVVIYFSGHGGHVENGHLNENYLLLFDTDPQALTSTAISGIELTRYLRQIRANRLLVFFDCCYAGGIGQAKEGGSILPVLKSGLDEELYERLGQGNGRAIVASSRSNEYSWVLPNMENSLFTHYLLQALRGEAPTQNDGVIRLFDVFDYVSQRVTIARPEQHPILKAELENNFAIALCLGGKKSTQAADTTSISQLLIQNSPDVLLTPSEQSVLGRMFAGYERLVIKGEFGSGFGGGRVFMVRSIKKQGAELPAVLKLGPTSLIQQEWEAYAQFIHHKLPSVAQIEAAPRLSEDGTWAGMRYRLAGDGRYYTESLRVYCRHASAEDVVSVLQNHLFHSMNDLWQNNHIQYEVHRGLLFDQILPVNMKISYEVAQTDTDIQTVTVDMLRYNRYQPGEQIILTNFVITEVNVAQQELTLNPIVPVINSHLPYNCRVRVIAVPNIAQYQTGQPLPHPLAGKVCDTRQTLLQQQLQQAFTNVLDLEAETISLPGLEPLPNPLLYLPSILNQTIDMRIGTIHGDLNLENVLVEFDHRNQKVHLIDFAAAREDAILHDLLRLETNFWLYLVPDVLIETGRGLTGLLPFARILQSAEAQPHHISDLEKPLYILTTIRQAARRYLVNPQLWAEYYQGLIIYLLGALKFKNLDTLSTAPLPKQVAFVTAAYLQQLLHERPDAPPRPQPDRGSSSPTAQRNDIHISLLPSKEPITKSQLLWEIRNYLTILDEFKTHEELQNIFDITESLHPFRDRLPDARNAKTRANKLVAYLQSRYNTNQENALILFLRALTDEYEGNEHTQLCQFADQLQHFLVEEK